MNRRFPILALALLAVMPARAAEVRSLRLLSLSKDAAVMRVTLSEPAAVSVSYGEEPGAWTATSKAAGADDTHELRLSGLSPDRRIFYQLDVDGAPVGEMGTFVSGRSWVTRRATIVVTAAPAGEAPEDAALAERIFAQESDVLVLLGDGERDLLERQHRRALTDRVALIAPDDPAPSASVADVVLGWAAAADLEAAAVAAGACWKVSLRGEDPSADVVVLRDGTPGITKDGERLRVVLSGRDAVVLKFAAGTLTASLLGGGETVSLQRACTVPKPAASAEAAYDELADELGDTLDGSGHDASCD